MRSLLATRLVVLVFAYQLLSAMGSQVLDFLVFDRAAARYTDASELTRFVALYTGLLNAVDIAFLLLLAAWLLTRFGLRLGLVANPAVVTVLTFAMLVATLGPGATSLLLFTLVVTARIVDLSLTDGVTRGSINAIFQLLPVEERMAVQASVEGIGVPMAIGATGIVLLLMTALDLGTSWIVAFALVLCSAWTVAAVCAYAEYRGALGVRLRRRGLDPDATMPVTDDEQTAARRLLLTDDVRDLRLGLDLGVTANLSSADLADLANHDDRDIRLLALGLLARRGDDEAAAAAVAEVRLLAGSDEVDERRAAALVLADIHPRRSTRTARQLLRTILTSACASQRSTAWDSSDGRLVDDVVVGLDDPTTMQAAVEAARRLGTPALALAARRLAEPGPLQARMLRLIGAVDVPATEAAAILTPLVEHPNRSVSIATLNCLARHDVTVAEPILDRLLADDAELAARALVAASSMSDADDAVLRSLEDLLSTIRDRVLAVLAVRYGEERISATRHALASPDGGRRALGIEMLHVSITRADAVLVDSIVRDDLDLTARLRRLPARAREPERDRLVVARGPRARPRASMGLDLVAGRRAPRRARRRPRHRARHARRIDHTPHIPPTPADRALAEVVLAASAGGRRPVVAVAWLVLRFRGPGRADHDRRSWRRRAIGPVQLGVIRIRAIDTGAHVVEHQPGRATTEKINASTRAPTQAAWSTDNARRTNIRRNRPRTMTNAHTRRTR